MTASEAPRDNCVDYGQERSAKLSELIIDARGNAWIFGAHDQTSRGEVLQLTTEDARRDRFALTSSDERAPDFAIAPCPIAQGPERPKLVFAAGDQIKSDHRAEIALPRLLVGERLDLGIGHLIQGFHVWYHFCPYFRFRT